MTKIDLTGTKELVPHSTQKQQSYLAMLLSNIVGEQNRKKFQLSYFNKKSCKDFNSEEIKLAIELCLNHQQLLLDHYDQLFYDDHFRA